MHEFETMLAFIFAEYYIGLKSLLRCNDMVAEDGNFTKYLNCLGNIRVHLNYLYFVFIQNLDLQ